jgi:hypothetical protein
MQNDQHSDGIARQARSLDDLKWLSEGVKNKSYKKKTIIYAEHPLPHVLFMW